MNGRKIEFVTLAYFSGTGGTEAIVNCFAARLSKAGVKVNRVDISCCNSSYQEATDLLIVFSPVYAFRLSSIVERWTKNLSKVQNTFAAVISVSGGGEVSPNTACRLYCKRLLAKKGYQVIYEKMLVMPSNFAVQAEDQLNLMLINAMPKKVEQILTEILSGAENITKPLLLDRLFAYMGRVEHFGARVFGTFIHASKMCNQCRLCVKKCPTKNIHMKKGTPRFGLRCMWCLKCIYSCPQNALKPRILKFSVLKEGYNLKEMSKKAKLQDQAKCSFSHNILWQGVIDYLKS